MESRSNPLMSLWSAPKPAKRSEEREGFEPELHLAARETIKGDNQLAEYVARLGISECAEILAESPEGLPFLAARRDECRVGSKETRSFEEVIKVWTLSVLSGAEGG